MLTDLLRVFPSLLNQGYRRTSSPTFDYNCVAWALHDTTQWWEPDPYSQLFWPPDVARAYKISNYVKLFANRGYSICADETLEQGFEKVAIYTDGSTFKHVARQLTDGKWTSKLGEMDDITHASLDALSGQLYGKPSIFLKKALL
jgi:hypothetical protein